MPEILPLVSQTERVLQSVVDRLGGVARPQQKQMALAVAGALAGESNLVVQAGTGVGKSLGYLVPTMLHSASTGARQLISTASLALQRQILVQDGPLVQEAVAAETEITLQVALLKGWSNYLCSYRLNGGLQTDDLLWDDPEEARINSHQVGQLQQWAEATETGDRDDFEYPVTPSAWARVSVTKRECLGKRCPFIADCFPLQAKEQAFEADVVVTNHALLGVYANGLSDVLPEFTGLVVDEAHDLAPRVRAQGTVNLSAGAVGRAARAVRKCSPSLGEELSEERDKLTTALVQTPFGLLTERPVHLQAALTNLDQTIRSVRRGVQSGGSSAEDAENVQLARAGLDSLQAALTAWEAKSEQSVTWISETAQGNPQLNIAPLDVAELLTRHLYAGHPTVIASATLTLGGDFKQIAAETGIDRGGTPCEFLDVGTSFEPRRQGILYVAKHLPQPNRDGVSAHFYPELLNLVNASGGGALGLFSSLQGAQAAAQYLREETDLQVLLQGEDNLPALIEQFRADEDACLFGTISLWQGVDVPGRACRLVIIDRIPFPRPDDPIVQARRRAATSMRRNGFIDSSLAPATLLMAQGSGRLVRTHSDQGVVAVLDSRLASKSYGNYIRRSMLPFWYTEDPQIVRRSLSRLRDGPESDEVPS